MRGVAVLLAASATWIAVSGTAPGFRPPALRVSPAAATAMVLTSCGTTGIAYAGTGILPLAVALGLLAGSVPILRATARAEAAAWDAVRAWPDILAQVRNGLAAGMPVTDALVEALARRGGAHAEVADLIRREAMFGGGLTAGVDMLRVGGLHPTSERVLVTLASASRSGGHLVGQIVGTLTRSVADDIRLREAHRAALTEQRMTIAVALIAPWLMLVLAVVTNPQAADAFGTTSGTIVIAVGAAATAIGGILARRAARLSAPPAVFR